MEVFVFCAAILIALWLGILIHELGHLVACYVLGLAPRELVVGGGRAFASFPVGKLEVRLKWNIASGHVVAFARSARLLQLRWFFMLLAGPLATVGYAAFVWRISQRPSAVFQSWLDPIAIIIIGWQAILFLTNLYPHDVYVDGKMTPSDGKQLWKILSPRRSTDEQTFLSHIATEAQWLMNRERVREAVDFLQAHIRSAAGKFRLEVLLFAIPSMHALGEKDSAEKVWQELEAAGAQGDLESHVTVLDGLACVPIYAGLNEYLPSALDCIEKAIALRPTLITLKGTKGSLLVELGRLEEGRALLEGVAAETTSDNDRAICAYYLALLAQRKGDLSTACELLKAAQLQFPDCVVATRISALVSAKHQFTPSPVTDTTIVPSL